MRKYIAIGLVCSVFAGMAVAAGQETFGAKEEGKTGLPSLVAKLNTNFSAIMAMTSATSLNTNALAITTGGIYKAFPVPTAGTTINTNTLPNASYAGQLVFLLVDPLATNTIVIAKSGNFAGPAVSLAPGEATVIIANKAGGTNCWSGIVQ